jgi:UDP-N-acetylmuramoyl-tripeptide--D-alanyl-D-alanine ligase
MAYKFKLSTEKIKRAVREIKSFAGRMQRLQGIKNSIIIDDSYNASPEAMKIALDTLYSFEAPKKIAILGMMNELGAISEEEHRKVGRYCDPKLLDLVVTVGKDANAFLAPEAKRSGCTVYEAKNALDAGLFVKEKIKDGSVVLAKGSQNGVFVEEALKPLLKNKSDFSKLVRQEEYWMKKKELTG